MTFCNGTSSKSVYWLLEEERRRQKMSPVSGPATAPWLPWGICEQWQNPSLARPPQFNYPSPDPSSGSKTWRPPSQPAALQSETFIDHCCGSTISLWEGIFHPYPAGSIRHPVTCLAQIGTCWILNKRDGSNGVCLCLRHRRHRFCFFNSVCQF